MGNSALAMLLVILEISLIAGPIGPDVYSIARFEIVFILSFIDILLFSR